ncbi:MAG: hypothetical protein ACR2IF_06665 [Terriglobales bacterium]
MVSFLVSMVVGFATLYLGVYVADFVESHQMQRCPQQSNRRRD